MRGTRKQRAAKLLERLERGPAFNGLTFHLDDRSPAAVAADAYRLWVRSWVLEELKALVPELREPRR